MLRFATALLGWYETNKRSLPWRGHRDPYAIWVSEIMLQQTRVEAVVPYFQRWMTEFPSIASLAGASEHRVLKAWEGLGYYSRARNLRRAAQLLVEEDNGRLPQTAGELRKLPGIGRYTAGAIASIAFGRDEAALDGNIRRVLSRVFNVAEPADAPRGERVLWELASRHLPKGSAGDFNQALMDLGATVCLPANPHCSVCPVRAMCEARKLGIQDQRPVLKAKAAVPYYLVVAGVIQRGRRALIALRPSKGLLGGMWEFPNARVRSVSTKSVTVALRKHYQLEVEVGEECGIVRHAYSHFAVEVHVFRCRVQSIPKDTYLRWIPITELEDFPMGKVDRQIARKLA